MRIRRLHKDSIRAVRRGFVVAALLAYFVAAVGVPLPVGVGKDRSIPFPCMDRPCGCHDAGGCKEHCCCFTSEQKFAWAARHEVDPAPFVNFSALAVARPAAGQQLQDHDQACCSTSPLEVDLSTIGRDDSALSTLPACHERVAAQSRDAIGERAPEAAGQPANDRDTISMMAYRTCHGLAPLWATLGAALPPPQALSYEFQWNSTGSLVSPAIRAGTLAFSPPTPPPRG